MKEIFESPSLPVIFRKKNQNLVKFKFKLHYMLFSRIIVKSKVNPVFIKIKSLLGRGNYFNVHVQKGWSECV